ncbi:methyltransferase domain-containing protein [Thiospirochaeta perfilievii]|uniref:Methyltransferase domain-containing protein n=1 Tax=Thiospirochaeta perfilievii TaxID=252967 RepID=A0A5C1QAZ6_9SPIO|nr:methyltransferase [Thiospirochaeta perfilievii]QEN04230.1 methyltransferase domain-containing protein [Thiospirochaeta perfilievii]
MKHNDYINKKVELNYNKSKLNFNLSQALFSSFSIDAGTSMLLKTVVKETDEESISSIYDIGCGVGVIGIALQKSFPNIKEAVLQDRDSLAVEFSKNNGELNGLSSIEYSTDLALLGVENRKFDLILSNIPAKAGEKVLINFLSRSGSFLNENGKCCVVIVASLANFAESTLKNAGCEILFKEYNKQYTVLHYRGYSNEYSEDFSSYIRNTETFDFDDHQYKMDTVYNVPDFDSLSFQTTLSMAMLSSYRIKGKALFVNPGQGHIPVYLSIKHGNDIGKIVVAGRDVLKNKITTHNLEKNRNKIDTESINIPYIDSLLEIEEESSFDFLGVEIEPVPGANWYSMIKETAKSVLKSGGLLFITGKSSPMHQLLKETKGFSPVEDKKFRGFRAVLLKKN